MMPVVHTEPTIRVVMLKSEHGYPDGHTRQLYQEGVQYDLPESLARCFFQTAHAQPVPEAISGPDLPQEGPPSHPAAKTQNAGPRPRQPRRKGV